ncbi:MAG TPA: hypothetical protein DCM26_05370 [Desulfotomaculum sp.]|jgi:hypothetical protein|nr:hypothetical protein [Desulfotomaculum sp.]
MEGEQRVSGLEKTLFSLLERSSGPGMDQGSLLILVSLLNLMGIVNLLTQRVNYKENKDEPQVKE